MGLLDILLGKGNKTTQTNVGSGNIIVTGDYVGGYSSTKVSGNNTRVMQNDKETIIETGGRRVTLPGGGYNVKIRGNKIIVNGHELKDNGQSVIIPNDNAVVNIYGNVGSLECYKANVTGDVTGDVKSDYFTGDKVGGNVKGTHVKRGVITGNVDGTHVTASGSIHGSVKGVHVNGKLSR